MMKSETSQVLIKKIYFRSIFLGVILLPVIFIFTRSLLYCIIFFCGTLFSLTGFFITVKMVDRLLIKKSGKLFFFTVLLLKLAVITVTAYAISKLPEQNFLFFVGGLSLVVLELMIEGFVQIFRSRSNGA